MPGGRPGGAQIVGPVERGRQRTMPVHAAAGPPCSNRKRSLRRSSTSAGLMARTLAAANSIARGIPSRWRHNSISTIRSSSGVNEASAAVARSTNSSTPSRSGSSERTATPARHPTPAVPVTWPATQPSGSLTAPHPAEPPHRPADARNCRTPPRGSVPATSSRPIQWVTGPPAARRSAWPPLPPPVIPGHPEWPGHTTTPPPVCARSVLSLIARPTSGSSTESQRTAANAMFPAPYGAWTGRPRASSVSWYSRSSRNASARSPPVRYRARVAIANAQSARTSGRPGCWSRSPPSRSAKAVASSTRPTRVAVVRGPLQGGG